MQYMRPQKRCAPYGEIAERGPGRTGGNLGHRPPRGRSIARWYKAARGFGRHRFTIRASFLRGVAAARPRQRFALARWAWSAESFLRPAANAVAKACVRGGGTAKPCRRGCVRLSELGGLDPCKRPRQPGRRVRIGGFFRCLRRGTFHRGKVPKTRRGLRPPVPRWGCAACIAGRGIAQAAAVLRAIPSHTACPFPASRGPVESGNRYRGIVTATVIFAKAAQTAPEHGVDFAHGSFYVRACVFAVDNAHCAFAPRSGLS